MEYSAFRVHGIIHFKGYYTSLYKYIYVLILLLLHSLPSHVKVSFTNP